MTTAVSVITHLTPTGDRQECREEVISRRLPGDWPGLNTGGIQYVHIFKMAESTSVSSST
jgi:hypothetical protein